MSKPLSAVDVDKTRELYAEAATRIQERFPNVEIRSGPFADLVLLSHSILAAAIKEEMDQYLEERSVKKLLEFPEQVSVESADLLASNFRVTRRPGVRASGSVVIVRNTSATITIASGARFFARGQVFISPRSQTSRADIEESSPFLRKATQRPDGNWVFTVDVIAQSPGSSGRLSAGTEVKLEIEPSGFIQAYTAADFFDGVDSENNKDLAVRLQAGLAAPGFSSRLAMLSLLQNDERFADIKPYAQSIIGAGDQEMVRDRRGFWPAATGGKIDWIIRTQEEIQVKKLTKQATLIDISGNGSGLWRLNFNENEIPACYQIRDIRPQENIIGSCTILNDVRGLNLTNLGYPPPDLIDEEGVYTRWQTMSITFRDDATLVLASDIGMVKDYQMEALFLPSIDVIQDEIADFSKRLPLADVVVKAPVPCFVKITVSVERAVGAKEINVEEMKVAMAQVVNRMGYVGRLPVSALIDVIHAWLTSSDSVAFVELLGLIRCPDGSWINLRSLMGLQIPDLPEKGVTRRTVQFFTSPEDISINIAYNFLPATF